MIRRVKISQTAGTVYIIHKFGERFSCTCKDFEFRHLKDRTFQCKHIIEVKADLNREAMAASKAKHSDSE